MILELGGIPGTSPDVFDRFRAEFAGRDGADLPIRVRRADRELTLMTKVRLTAVTSQRIAADPQAGERALRVRQGLFTGTTAK